MLAIAAWYTAMRCVEQAIGKRYRIASDQAATSLLHGVHRQDWILRRRAVHAAREPNNAKDTAV